MATSDTRELLEKAKHFCSYQERCTREVERKLAILGASEQQKQEVIESLKEARFLDDHRFALEYALGRFRNNKWGKVKIRLELASRGLPLPLIREALDGIDPDEYLQTLEWLVDNKLDSLQSRNAPHAKEKAATFCTQKGYEADLVWDTIRRQLK
jgi:regulatory protein